MHTFPFGTLRKGNSILIGSPKNMVNNVIRFALNYNCILQEVPKSCLTVQAVKRDTFPLFCRMNSMKIVSIFNSEDKEVSRNFKSFYEFINVAYY